jgi:hypothetical protein
MRPATNALPLGLVVTLGFATAGPLDPDCTAEKAAKSAAMKATVGVGGRCSPKERPQTRPSERPASTKTAMTRMTRGCWPETGTKSNRTASTHGPACPASVTRRA